MRTVQQLRVCVQAQVAQLEQACRTAEAQVAANAEAGSPPRPTANQPGVEHGTQTPPLSTAAGNRADPGSPTAMPTHMSSISSLSMSPFRAGTLATSAAAPAADADRATEKSDVTCNPLFNEPTSQPPKAASRSNSASPLALTRGTTAAANTLPAVADKCSDEDVLIPYLQLLQALTALLMPPGDGAMPLEPSGAVDAAASLQQRAAAAESTLATLFAELQRRKAALPRGHSTGAFDSMRSMSSCGDTPSGSQPPSPYASGMARLSHIVTSLLDSHKRQLSLVARCAQGLSSGGAVPDGAAGELRQRLAEMKQHADEAREELRRLKEVSSQQESEVAIQWNEKQQLQQAAHAELSTAQQARSLRLLLDACSVSLTALVAPLQRALRRLCRACMVFFLVGAWTEGDSWEQRLNLSRKYPLTECVLLVLYDHVRSL